MEEKGLRRGLWGDLDQSTPLSPGTSQARRQAAVLGSHGAEGGTPLPGTWGCGPQMGPGATTPGGSSGICPHCAQMGISLQLCERFP